MQSRLSPTTMSDTREMKAVYLDSASSSDAELLPSSQEGSRFSRMLGRKTMICVGCALGLAGMAIAGYASRPATSASSLNVVEEWEQWPSMDEVVERAKNLPVPEEVRKLEVELYSKDPAEFGISEFAAMRAQCVIDTVQAAAYLGQAVVFLYKAINSGSGLKCPDDSEVGCAVSIAGFVTSIAWVASYLSLAASSCADSVNSASLCVADFTGMIANAGELATVCAAVKEDCDFGDDVNYWINTTKWIDGKKTQWKDSWDPKAQDKGNGRTAEQELIKSKTWAKVHKIDAYENLKLDRQFDSAQCAFDITQSASYIVRAFLQIRSASSACDDAKNCAINILNIISSFAWISQFTGLAVSDCQDGADQRALCTADISDMIAASNNFCAAGMASTIDCADSPDPAEEEKIQPSDRRLRAAGKA